MDSFRLSQGAGKASSNTNCALPNPIDQREFYLKANFTWANACGEWAGCGAQGDCCGRELAQSLV
jgi:hypothetical protein